MRHAVECARQTARVVPALPGGAAAHRRRSCPGPSRVGPHAGSTAGRAAGEPAAAARLPVDRRAPGCRPPQRRRRRVLAPTPRYPGIRAGASTITSARHPRRSRRFRPGRRPDWSGSALRVTAIVLAGAAAVHLVRYVLLVINRTTLLHPVVAGAALWLGVVASVSALAAVIVCAVVLTRWLIARRAAVYAHFGAKIRVGPVRCGRAAWYRWSTCVGAGLRHRDRGHRGGLQPLRKPIWCGGCCGC